MQATHLFLKGDDLGWGAPAQGLGDDLGWGGEAARDVQECGGRAPPLGLLERDIRYSQSYPVIAVRSTCSQPAIHPKIVFYFVVLSQPQLQAIMIAVDPLGTRPAQLHCNSTHCL